MEYEINFGILEKIKEAHRAAALTEHLYNLESIEMENVSLEEFWESMKGEDSKYELISSLGEFGVCSIDSKEKAWSVMNNLTAKQECRIYTEAPHWVICWGPFGTSDIVRFEEHFKIKEKYAGWEAGIQYGV